MPWHRTDYPHDWATHIRPAILDRARHCCEGSPAYPACRAPNHQPHQVTGSHVVLTLAHTCACESKCGEPSHLLALCNRCHLTLDAGLHAQHAAATRRRQQEALGQLRLWEPV